MRSPICLALGLALAALACASGSSTPSLPTWSADQELPLTAASVTQIQMAAIRHLRRSEQQVMCIGVLSGPEFRGGQAVNAPETLLRLLGSRNQYRPYTDCEVSRSDRMTVRSEVVTVPERSPATRIVLATPFGFSEDRAVINASELSRRTSARYRCEAQLAEGFVWNIVRCVRERG